MCQHKPEILRQAGSRDLQHACAVQPGNDAFQAQIVSDVCFHCNIGALLHEQIDRRRYHQNPPLIPALLRHPGLARLLGFLHRCWFCQRCRRGLGACFGSHDTIYIGVNLGNNNFPLLPCQCRRCRQLLSGFVRVQLVDGECKDRSFFRANSSVVASNP